MIFREIGLKGRFDKNQSIYIVDYEKDNVFHLFICQNPNVLVFQDMGLIDIRDWN